MPHTISRFKLPTQIFKYLVFLWLVSGIKYSRCSERFGKLITEGKLCTDLDVDDANGEYTDLGTDVDIPMIFHHTKALQIPYPHTLRIVVPIGSVIQFGGFAAMAVDESGIPTGRFHSCSLGNEQQSKIVSGRCTISKDDWELTFMGYQDPLRILSTEKFPKAIEFYWTWLEDRQPPNLIQFRFLGIEKSTTNSRAKFYGVLASPVVETTELFRKTPPITLHQLNEMQCFKNVELQSDNLDVSSSDYYSIAVGFAPQHKIPLNPKYLKVIQDNKDKFTLRHIDITTAMLIDDIEESTTTTATTTEKTTKRMAHRRHRKGSVTLKHKKSGIDDLKAKREPEATSTTTLKVTTELVVTTAAEEATSQENPILSILESLPQKSAIYLDSQRLIESETKSIPVETPITKTSLVSKDPFLIFQKKSPSAEKLGKSSRKISSRTDFKRPIEIPAPSLKQKTDQREQEMVNVIPDDTKVTDVSISKHTTFHAISMLFIWLVCIPNAIFITRYFRETPTSKKYCGRSLSSILHVQLLLTAFILTAVSLGFSFWDFFNSERSNDLQKNSAVNVHIYFGVASSVLFGSFVSFGCITCDRNKQCAKAFMHCIAGNTSYILALIMIWRSYYIGMPCATWMISLLWIIWTVTANIIMCSHFYWEDRVVGIKNYFRAFVPLPIEHIIQEETPGIHIKERILWWHFGGSWIAFIFITLLYSIKDAKSANCQFEFVLGCLPEDH